MNDDDDDDDDMVIFIIKGKEGQGRQFGNMFDMMVS